MRTVELLPDPVLSAAVRELWDRLRAAGLRSLATHGHPTNRPHVTLGRVDRLDTIPELRLPIPVSLREVRVLGRALVWAVVPTPELETVRDAVGRSLVVVGSGEWVPHVSLALKMPADQRAAALNLLGDVGPVCGQLVGARSYDPETRTVTEL